MSEKNFRDSSDSVILYIIIAAVIALIFYLLPEGSYRVVPFLFWPAIFLYAIFKKKT